MKLFVSYARIDEYKIYEIVDILRAASFDPHWDDQIAPGDDWKKELQVKIESSEAFIFLMSPDSVNSDWCLWELNKASELSKPIIPILIRDNTEIPLSIKQLNYLDARGQIRNSKVAQLVVKLMGLKQNLSIRNQVKKNPKGFPSRVKRSLSKNYKTVSESYFEDLTDSMTLYKYEKKNDDNLYRNHNLIIGIDFGTSVSSITVITENKVELIPNEEGVLSIPTAIAINHNSKPIFGNEAIDFLSKHPYRGVIEVKRILGDYSVDGLLQVIVIDDIAYKPEDFVTLFLEYLLLCAGSYLQSSIEEVVLTAPAYFSSHQYNGLIKALENLEIRTNRIIAEPVAACLSTQMMDDAKWLIYDLGGGTFDVSVLELGDGVFEVLSVNGDANLGGADFDKILVDYCIDRVKEKYNVDLKDEISALIKVRNQAEKVKILLSSQENARIYIPKLLMSNGNELELDIMIHRSEYNDMIKGLIDITIDLSKKAVEDADFKLTEIDKVLVVGRASRGYGIIQSLKDVFGNKLQLTGDHAVAIGAGIQAGVIKGHVKGVLLLDVINRGIRLSCGERISIELISKNTTVPTKKSRNFRLNYNYHQPFLQIKLFQGDSILSKNNIFLYQTLVPINPSLKEFEVTLDINADHSLKVEISDDSGKTLQEKKLGLRKVEGTIKESIGLNGVFPIYSTTLSSELKIGSDKNRILMWVCNVTAKYIVERYNSERSEELQEYYRRTGIKQIFSVQQEEMHFWKSLFYYLERGFSKGVFKQHLENPIYDKFRGLKDEIIEYLEILYERDFYTLKRSSSIKLLCDNLFEALKI